jgi:hypothetical protein
MTIMPANSNYRMFTDPAEILRRSLFNCHARGLDSYVLGEGAHGELIRVFWAGPDGGNQNQHSLRIRSPDSEYLQLAVHSHHCDLDFTLIYGTMINVRAKEAEYGCGNKELKKWVFRSKIAGVKDAGFEKECYSDGRQRSGFFRFDCDFLTEENRKTSMKANDLHTVFVPACSEAMWLVKEHPTTFGRESTKICYSNADLSNFSFDGLYQPMEDNKFNREQVAHVLDMIRHWL